MVLLLRRHWLVYCPPRLSTRQLLMNIVRNSIQTPDGTVLLSRYKHDFAIHDDLNGETYMIDGGLDSLRRSVNHERATELTVYLEDGHQVVRSALEWGTFAMSADRTLSWIKLKNMATPHIEYCLLSSKRLHPVYKISFELELEYRALTY